MLSDRKWLESRIRRATWKLNATMRASFQLGRFNYEAKRVTSSCGRWALQWEPRGREGFVTFIEVQPCVAAANQQ